MGKREKCARRRSQTDGSQLFSRTGAPDRSSAGPGVTAATGDANNWHIIDDMSIQDPIKVNIDIKPGSFPNIYGLRGRSPAENIQRHFHQGR